MKFRFPKFASFLLILMLAVPQFLVPTAAAPTPHAGVGDVTTAGDVFAAKIHPKLQAAAAAAAPTTSFDVIVYAEKGVDLSPYLSRILVRPYVLPNGTQAVFGQARAAQLDKLASLSQVAAITDLRYTGERPIVPELGPQRADVAAESSQSIATVADWFDVLDVHKSKKAWDLGFTGEGVKVMVNDTGTDFAHPDLQGTVARITDPDSPYNGWPEMFDSFSMLNLAYDYYLGTDYVSSGVGIFGLSPDYADTRATRSGAALTTNPDGTLLAIFAPIGSKDPDGHIYKFKATSKSGVYHFGSHPDTTLAVFHGERPAVLVVDENTAGVYDTVYVDLNDNYNFTDDKKAVKGNEYIYADVNGDGYADRSGGIIYWISDGVNPLPASDWMWGMGADVAGPGELVAFSINDVAESGDHGTLCASGVAAQGVVDGGAPAFKPAGDGTPGTGMVVGGGKNVKLTSNGDMYTTAAASTDALLFAASGYDGFPGTDDDIQIVSDSWGNSGVVNDGWDYESRTFDLIQRLLNPNLLEVNSSGNGGPGYGTNNSPGANLSASIGASTLYGSDGVTFDSNLTVDQLLYNDSMSFSDRGPTAQAEVGIAALANGAWGGGDIPLNEFALSPGGFSRGDGWNTWENWGGTSRSTPVAAGNLALAYSAFKGKYGRWPTNVEGRAILMGGADTAHNDGFVEGAGVINAERMVKIAAGQGGVYVLPDSVTFGDFRGTKYDAFTSIMHAGQTATQNFTVHNPGASAVTLQISDDQLVRLAQREIDFTTQDQKRETPVFTVPDYLIDIEPYIPAGAELMEVKLVQPFTEFDPDGNYAANSSWRVVPTDWTDNNGDGVLWTDKNSNGVINCAGGNFASSACEIQEGEYMRFGYGYSRGTSSEQRVMLPLERMHDGIFVGLSHRSRSATVPVTHFKIQLNFYKEANFPWLTTDAAVTVPAGGEATFTAKMAVPALANVGLYEATIRLSDGENTTNVPVVANVAAFSTDFLFGGPPETKTPYDNGLVYGFFDWTARAESGDWRFYYMDVPDSTPAGTALLVDTRWTGANTDIDTLIMGPTEDCYSNGVGCSDFSKFPGFPPVYGPYSLAPVGGSNRLNPSAGVWYYDTSTGGSREIVAANVKPGLNLVALHNTLFDGGEPEERFQGQVGTISATPMEIDQFIDSATSGRIPMSIKSSLALAGLEVKGFGLGTPDIREALPQIQDNPDDPSTSSYQIPVTIKNGALLEATTTADSGDLDLFVLYDFNADGYFDFDNEIIGRSAGSDANESVSVTFPPDGDYLVGVHGWGIDPGATFDLMINAVQGDGLKVGSLPAGPYQPNMSINFTVDWLLAAPLPAGGEAFGQILAGPPGAPAALSIPVRLHNVTAGVESQDFAAAQDALIHGGMKTTNYGAAKYLHVGGNDYNRSVLSFDVSGIPVTYPVVSAKLKVYVDAYSGGGSAADLAAYALSTGWNEATVTWKTPWTQPGGDFAPTAVSTPILKTDVGAWKEFDVTPWVQQWVSDATTNHGVLLRLINQTSFTVYRLPSSEYWDPAYAPVLSVTYGVP